MCPSADRHRLSAVLIAAACALAIASPPALAKPNDPLPVIDVVAPVLDIETGTADLKREARVERQGKKIRVTLDATVLFGKDSAKINARAHGRLDEVATDLRQAGPGTVKITGYTDDLGSARHGLVLSRQRARAVAGELRRQLPKADYPFRLRGRGERNPAVPNTSEANRRINRRVVVEYQPR